MREQQYALCFFTDGRLSGLETIRATSLSQAMQQAYDKEYEDDLELWQNGRLLVRILAAQTNHRFGLGLAA